MKDANKKEPGTIESYFTYHKEAVKKYGDNAIVMMRVGDFYEFYSYPDEGPDIDTLGKKLEIIKTCKDKTKPIKKYGNPELVGFNHRAENKFVGIMMEDGYVVVVVEEIHGTEIKVNRKGEEYTKKKVTRYIDRVYSQSTYDNDTSESNYLVSITIEEIKQRNGSYLVFAGMAAADIFTGKVFINESISNKNDTRLALDECNRFIDTLLPKEIIVNCQNLKSVDKEHIISYLDLSKKDHSISCKPDSKYGKVSYQTEVLEKVYEKEKSMVNIIVQLGLEHMDYSRKALVHLFDFAMDHSSKFTNNIDYPVLLINEEHMVLGNNAHKQLNIIKSETFESNHKVKCLFDVINKSCTHMGRRFIERRLTSPLVNPEILQQIYDNVNLFIKYEFYEDVRLQLKGIRDIEKLGRKIDMRSIPPSQLYTYIMSIKECNILFKMISLEKKFRKLNTEEGVIDCKKLHSQTKKILKLCDSYFDYEKMKNYNSTSPNSNNENFINVDIDEKISELIHKMDNGNEYLERIGEQFYKFMINSLIKGKTGRDRTNLLKTKVIVKSDRARGYYIKFSTKRGKELKEYIEKNKIKNISLEKTNVKTDTFEWSFLKTDCKIFMPVLTTFSRDMENIQELFEEQSEKIYNEFLDKINSKYGKDMMKIRNTVTLIDYYTTVAFVTELCHYTMPRIKEYKDGFMNAINLRHPIVEDIIDHEYVPHNVKLGKDIKGMLVYGINSSGKSVMMKAVGLSIVMAQAGFFVPAEKFSYYPYTALYARITGYDNLFKGQSSFAVGMTELNAIIKRSDNRTLVLGDEVGRSTESISAHAIVAATLIELSQDKSSFIFSTHLHDLGTVEKINSCEHIKSFHLAVERDDKDNIVYDRILREGSGERVYGVTVAKSIIKCNNFIKNAEQIKNDLLNIYGDLVVNKTSNYNSKKYVYECEVCGVKLKKDHNNLESHHINFQKDFDEKGVHKNKKHIKKNAKSNILTVCEACHDDVHNGKITITSVKMTSSGVKADIKINK